MELPIIGVNTFLNPNAQDFDENAATIRYGISQSNS